MFKYLKNKKGTALMELFILINVVFIGLLILLVLAPNLIGFLNSNFNGSNSIQVQQNLIVK